MPRKKTLYIKVPVYTTEVIKDLQDGEFSYPNYPKMVNYIKEKLEYAKYPHPIYNAAKTKTTIIEDVLCDEVLIGDRQSLLVQISAYNTNQYGRYFEDDSKQKREITNTNRIGSDNNFIVLYPIALGGTAETQTCYFLMAVYEDPSKDNGEVIKLAKRLLERVLNIKMQNIKMETLLEELKQSRKIPELNIKFSSIEAGDNNVNILYKEYLVETKKIHKKDRKFQNVPSDIVEGIINDDTDEEDYQTKETQIRLGKKEYKIKHIRQEAAEELRDTIERIFNERVEVNEEEINSKAIYDTDFIIEKITTVINNYFGYI